MLGSLTEMHFRFKKVEKIIHIFVETRDKTDTGFSQYMTKLLAWLTNLVQKKNNHVNVESR